MLLPFRYLPELHTRLCVRANPQRARALLCRLSCRPQDEKRTTTGFLHLFQQESQGEAALPCVLTPSVCVSVTK